MASETKKRRPKIDPGEWATRAGMAKLFTVPSTTMQDIIDRGELTSMTLGCGETVYRIADMDRYVQSLASGKRKLKGRRPRWLPRFDIPA